jgi:phage regulator Rha-like protein
MQKNIFTAKWFKEFKEMRKKEKAQAGSNRRGEAQAASVRPQAQLDKSNKQEDPGAEVPGSGRKHQAP